MIISIHNVKEKLNFLEPNKNNEDQSEIILVHDVSYFRLIYTL